MEYSLHRQLKSLYAGDAQTEVRLGSFRIDAVVDGELIEIQHGSLSAIRRKVAKLLEEHQVRVVKPIVAAKLLLKSKRAGGRVTSTRWSPKRGTLVDLFHELVYFTRVFPHPRLTLEVPLVELEERRYPGHGRRWRRRANDHVVEDQRLVGILETHQFQTAADLHRLLPPQLPATFHTAHLAEGLGIQRWVAQRIAYCLRETGAAQEAGKQGNTRLYVLAPQTRRRRAKQLPSPRAA
ncbi:MAG: hypothetical protein KF708_12365 [Pirellulales bacterium]|nr:hypothetical protein [Pirellulales bacterium]